MDELKTANLVRNRDEASKGSFNPIPEFPEPSLEQIDEDLYMPEDKTYRSSPKAISRCPCVFPTSPPLIIAKYFIHGLVLHEQAPSTQNQRRCSGAYTPITKSVLKRTLQRKQTGGEDNLHKPLESREFDCLHPFPQSGYFLLNPCFGLLDAHLLAIRLLSNSALFQVQVQSN